MNRATKIIVSTFGVLLGLSGMDHGFFEALQGNTPTHALFIQAIGAANRMWLYGSEDAFTIIPNFLVSGILAMTVGLVVIVWSGWYVQKQHGPLVLILLFILLFVVGGGVAQVVMFTLAWAVATRINKPLTWWRKVLPEKAGGWLTKWWPFWLATGSLLFIAALEMAVVGFFPGVSNPEQIQHITWSVLGVGLVCYLLAIVAGFAYDIQESKLE